MRLDEVAKAINEATLGHTVESFALTLMKIFKSSTLEAFCALVRKINAERGLMLHIQTYIWYL